MTPEELVRNIPFIVRPNVANFGFAIFLASNITVVMGGAFPFLSTELQTSENMFTYYLAQSLAAAVAFFVGVIFAIKDQSLTRIFFELAVAFYFIGCFLTILATYILLPTIYLFFAGGIFLGMGSAGLLLAWQRVFASQSNRTGSQNLIVGTAYSTMIYFAFYLIPIAVTQLLVPLLFLPLSILCLVISQRSCDFDQAMFNDHPIDHPHVYACAVKDYWRSAICIGSIGLASGIVRALAITNASVGSVVNAAAVVGSFAAAVILLTFWKKRGFRFRILAVFRVVYPLLIISFSLLPLLGNTYANILSSLLYMIYSFSSMLMLMQCAQSSRDRGINPVVMYGGFAGLVYLLHDFGFICGYTSEAFNFIGIDPYWMISLIALVLLSFAHYIGYGGLTGAISSLDRNADRIELVDLSVPSQLGFSPAASQYLQKETVDAELIDQQSNDNFYSYSFCEQCFHVQRHYGLTDREREVMELLAKGRSMRAVADDLVVSENTIRTHAKRIYAKLAVHKRKELQDLIALF